MKSCNLWNNISVSGYPVAENNCKNDKSAKFNTFLCEFIMQPHIAYENNCKSAN